MSSCLPFIHQESDLIKEGNQITKARITILFPPMTDKEDNILLLD